jgi:TonB-dependent starch-binding outer membrane protein SusC
MKKISVFLVFCSDNGSFQPGSENLPKVTLNVKQMPLGEVFKEITKQTGIPVSYSVSQIPVTTKVNVKVKNKPAEQVLQDICKPFSLTVTFVENQYVIKPKKEIEDNDPSANDITKYATLSGYVS